MSDVFTKAKRSEVMSRVRSHGNKDTEVVLARLMRAEGITGWRRQLAVKFQVSGLEFQAAGRRRAQVRPDFVFPKARVAVFVDGCYWHGCPKHGTWPKQNAAFWRAKIEGNRARDRKVTRKLRAEGWTVVRIWEHALKKPGPVMARLRRAVGTMRL